MIVINNVEEMRNMLKDPWVFTRNSVFRESSYFKPLFDISERVVACKYVNDVATAIVLSAEFMEDKETLETIEQMEIDAVKVYLGVRDG